MGAGRLLSIRILQGYYTTFKLELGFSLQFIGIKIGTYIENEENIETNKSTKLLNEILKERIQHDDEAFDREDGIISSWC